MTNPIQTAIQKLRNGEIIGIPTETVYGLAVDAGNNAAIDALYALKERNAAKRFQIMVKTLDDARMLVKIDARTTKIAKAFLPGPLSIVLPCKEGDGTLAIRTPINSWKNSESPSPPPPPISPANHLPSLPRK